MTLNHFLLLCEPSFGDTGRGFFSEEWSNENFSYSFIGVEIAMCDGLAPRNVSLRQFAERKY